MKYSLYDIRYLDKLNIAKKFLGTNWVLHPNYKYNPKHCQLTPDEKFKQVWQTIAELSPTSQEILLKGKCTDNISVR